MKRIILVLVIITVTMNAWSQDMAKFKLYDPAENAETKIKEATREAKASGKYVFIQVGGNWCIWCARFHDFITSDKAIDSLVKSNFIVYHLNWSKENRNEALLAKYKFPQRMGYPVFLILNDKGELVHTQNSAYLEEGKGYDKMKVMEFFLNWAPSAFDPAKYKDQ